MNYEFVIDNCLDNREFRNLIYAVLFKSGFTNLSIDDVRVADKIKINDNDLLAMRHNVKYTVQTFLNVTIDGNQISETIKDIKKEKADAGIIVTNYVVSSEIKSYAKQYNIEIWDKDILLKALNEQY